MEKITIFNERTQKEETICILNFHTDGLSEDELDGKTLQEYAEENAVAANDLF